MSADGQRELLLLADDSISSLAIVSMWLQQSGYDVITATRGDDALMLARQRHPQLVMLDIGMPGLDGIEVTHQLRADRSFAEVPIVLLTSHTLSEYLQVGLEAGADAYIVKPVGPEKLRSLVDELLRGRRSLAA